MMDETKEKLNASEIVNFLINGATNKLNEGGRQNLYEWGVEMIEKYAEQSPETGQVDAIVIGLQDRIELLAAKKKQAEGKTDGEPGGGEAFWDGKLRECQTIMNLIAKKAL